MKWNDELVKGFTKIACSGSYGLYEDCPTLELKMKRFKELSNEKKIKYICKECGSEEVKADAYAAWDEERQDWSVAHVFFESEHGHACETCDSNGDGNVELISVPVTEVKDAVD